MASQQVRSYYTRYQLDRFVQADHIEQFTTHHFAQGQSICEVEQPVEQLLFFVEGQAKVVFPVETARQLLLCFYKPLQLFGDVELFEQEPRATTTVEAMTPCVCLGLNRTFVLQRLAHDPVFLAQLYRSLSKKLQRVIRNSALNLLHPLESRVASYIVATATRNAEQQLVFSGNLTQIADALGTSFRHLHRTLQVLCREGLLVKVRTTYHIQQLSELEHRAAGLYVVS